MRNFIYSFIGFLVLYMHNAKAESIPFAEKLADQAGRQSIFEFLLGYLRDAGNMAFVAIGIVIFVVWIYHVLSKWGDLKDDKIDKMQFGTDLGLSTLVAVLLFMVNGWATTSVAG
ncbi:hypothetical protein [Pseudoalteromonas luteoviolacea]|uniref:Integrating conjugative element membrane protein n=1 Tax=Pseudoalteromonas luteoviolacea S4060-1 TaxID=1365257 RepID=A0A161YNJ4_9GAMM|nr:hypothetical protein [Pseudoalteromonas luteoviolacea]KZN63379.1 hypothetical protein N478_03760 [Pseudoalteromonas luteoviolacea S4060-1]